MSRRERHVLVLTEYYYSADVAASGRIMTEMAEDMAAARWSVDVVCGYPSYLGALCARTEASLDHCGLRRDHQLMGRLPVRERIVINDTKPRGLETAVALNIPRDKGMNCE